MRTRNVWIAITLSLSLGLSLALGTAQAGPYADPGHDIAAMQGWASWVDDLVRGPMDIANPSAGDASWGSEANVLGPATGNSLEVLSLGDGGSITLGFDSPIGDGPGADFAVFENGFWTEAGLFAELAFVEVSSNGLDFARFDAVTLSTLPVPDGSELDPSDYYNLAGDQAAGLGTGFDLAELTNDALVVANLLDLQDVNYVRLTDVIGDGSTLDADGSPVYDPYSTAYPTGGFDLDGVGVLHVPEPGLALMLGFGFLTLLTLARWRDGQLTVPHLIPATLCSAMALSGFAGSAQATTTADFEDLGLGAESFWNGSDLSGGFTSAGVHFPNVYDAGWNSWYGFSASATTDTSTAGYGNQYSSAAGGGAGGSASYGVFFDNPDADPHLALPQVSALDGAYFSNTTYAYLSMLNGDTWAKKFGGAGGGDPDWFRLTISGYDGAGALAGSVDFYLADFRFANDAEDYIVDTWTWVDLSSLGEVAELGFALDSTDYSYGFMNTPGYFAIDGLAVIPEPGTALLLGTGLLGLALARRH